MEGQISIFDWMPRAVPVPEMWECMQTCENCGKYMSHFPNMTDGMRCDYGLHMDGTSGEDMYERIDANGYVHFYCKYYEWKK